MRISGWVALSGCAGTGPTGLADPAPFAACAVPVGGFGTIDTYAGVEAALSGPVLDAGTGTPPDGCYSTLLILSTPEVDLGLGSWPTAADADGVPWTVAMVLPDGATLGLQVDDEVQADFAYQSPGFGPTVASLTVRDGDAQLRGWVGLGGDLPDLEPPDGLALARGPKVGSDEDGCGAWSYYDILASQGGDSVTLEYGQEASLGGLRLWHGGLEQTDSYGGCPDWFVAHAAVAAAP